MESAYIALLKGINVAGHRPVAMADLRGLLTHLGFTDARSLLNSGNLLFRSRPRKGAQLERQLEAEARKRLALQTEFFVRSAEEWKAVVEGNPFPREAERDPGRLIVMCFKDAPAVEDVKALQGAITGPEVVRAEGRQAYIIFPDGMGRSRLTHALIERKLRTRGTGRNWNTVLKLNTLAGRP